MAKTPKDDRPLAEQIAEEAAQNTLALNPLVGMRHRGHGRRLPAR